MIEELFSRYGSLTDEFNKAASVAARRRLCAQLDKTGAEIIRCTADSTLPIREIRMVFDGAACKGWQALFR